jgi:hypothetical protein
MEEAYLPLDNQNLPHTLTLLLTKGYLGERKMEEKNGIYCGEPMN